jgi:hypothetical protein
MWRSFRRGIASGAAGHAGSLEIRLVSQILDYSVRAAFLRFASLRLRLTLGFS